MSLATLQWLRFATPGILILLLGGMLGKVTGLWEAFDPKSLTDMGVTVIIPAAVYYFTPFRTWSNKKYFDEVSESLRSKMVAVAKLKDDPKKYSWQHLRGIFYSLVDNDASLTVKTNLAYFNGYVWTTVADLRVIAYAYVLPCVGLYFIGLPMAFWTGFGFLCLGTLTVPLSGIVTKQQRDIGDEQMEIVQQKYAADLRKSLDHLP